MVAGPGREFEVEHLSNLTQEEAIEFGTKIGALIGLGIDGEEGAEAGPRRARRWRRPRASTSSVARRTARRTARRVSRRRLATVTP
jgi:hypothetical protein